MQEPVFYRTKDGLADYGFSIEPQMDGTYRAYVLSRSGSPAAALSDLPTHMTGFPSDRRGSYLPAFPPPTTILATQQLIAAWADEVQEYITSTYGQPARTPKNNITAHAKKKQSRQSPKASAHANLKSLNMTPEVWDKIARTVGRLRAETGGVLGGNREKMLVTHFYFDNTAQRSGATYSPDYERINILLKEEWNPNDIKLLGFVHSHPPYCLQPSGGDLIYARALLEHNPEWPCLLLPIVESEADAGEFRLHPFQVVRHNGDVRTERLDLKLVSDVTGTPTQAQPRLEIVDTKKEEEYTDLTDAAAQTAQPQAAPSTPTMTDVAQSVDLPVQDERDNIVIPESAVPAPVALARIQVPTRPSLPQHATVRQPGQQHYERALVLLAVLAGLAWHVRKRTDSGEPK